MITITTSSPAVIDQFLIKLDINFSVVYGVLTAVVDKTQANRLYQICNTEPAKTLVVVSILNAVPDSPIPTPGEVVPVTVTLSGNIPLTQYWSSMGNDGLTLILPPLDAIITNGTTYYIKCLQFDKCKVIPFGEDQIDDEFNTVLTFGNTQVIQVKADLKRKTWLVF